MIPAVPAKSLLSARYEGGWFGANHTMNLYRGCCHGCIYCDSRYERYNVADFDTVHQKENALALLENELRRLRRTGTVISGAMSDCYNPFEGQLLLMRGALRLFREYHFGVAIDTKGDLVLRDIDLLQQIGNENTACVGVTITTPDDALAAKIEPYAPPSSRRFAVIRALSDAGIDAGVLLMPVLPFITDDGAALLQLVRMARDAGAKWIYPGGDFCVTLRQNQRVYFLDRADAAFPGMKSRYIAAYGDAAYCHPPGAGALYRAFTDACQEAGLLHDMADITPYVERRRPVQTSLL